MREASSVDFQAIGASPSASRGQLGRSLHLPAHRFVQTGQRQRQRGFAGAVRADQRGDLSGGENRGRYARRWPSHRGRWTDPARTAAPGQYRRTDRMAAHRRCGCGRSRPRGGGIDRQPDAEFGEVESGITEHLVRGAVGDDDRAFESAAVDLLLIALLGDAGGLLFAVSNPSTTTRSIMSDPRSGAVLDQHHRGMIGVEHIAYRVHDLDDAVGGRGSPWVRRAAARPDAWASAPARASRCICRRTGAGSNGAAEPLPVPTARRPSRTRCQIWSRGTLRFSGPNATLSPSRWKIACASGSCSTRPMRPRARVTGTSSTSTRPSVTPPSASVVSIVPSAVISVRSAFSSPPSRPAAPSRIVDLPMPDAPSSSTRCPASMVMFSPRTAKCRREA